MTVPKIMVWAKWKFAKVARRYIATWEDMPWEEARLPHPKDVFGTAVWFHHGGV